MKYSSYATCSLDRLLFARTLFRDLPKNGLEATYFRDQYVDYLDSVY